MENIVKKLFQYCLLLSLLLYNQNSEAQIFTGGNIGFQVNNGNTVFDASPMIGYRMKNFEAGVSPFFTYVMPKNSVNEYLYGGRIFSKYHAIEGLFLHAEFEGVNIHLPNEATKRKWTLGLPLGAGYEHRVGKVRVHASILYDVLLDPDSGKQNPIYRGGITYDF